MSYTKNTWVTGDTITAQKLNNMENGIANASGAASIRLGATGFDSGSKVFGYIRYAYRLNDQWVQTSRQTDPVDGITLYGYGLPLEDVVTVLLPSDEEVGLFIVQSVGNSQSMTGDISRTSETIYTAWGSVAYSTAFRVYGNCSFSFQASGSATA